MTVNVLMPALSPTMEQGKLAKWLKNEGDTVKAGDVIAEIETDKATMEVEAVDEGVLARILVPGGAENVAVNTPIARDRRGGRGDPVADPSLNMRRSPEAPGEEDKAQKRRTPRRPCRHPRRPASRRRPVSGEPEVPAGTTMIAMTMREALRDAMAEEMRRDPDVFVIGEEVAEYQGAYKVTQGLLQEFGARRVVDTPITEYGFAGLGVGAAFAGLRPIVEFMTFNFAMQAIDHIVNSAAKTLYMSGGQINCPIVFRGPNGAAARVAAQHSQDYSAWYSQVPGLKVIAPSNASDAKGLLKSGDTRQQSGRLSRKRNSLREAVGRAERSRISSFRSARRASRAPGTMSRSSPSRSASTHALAAAETLAKEGIEAEVIDLRTLRPMDVPAIIASVKKTGRCVAIEEGWPQSGVGAEIAARVQEEAFDYLDAPVLRVTGKDVPMPYAANLEKLALPSVADVVAAAKAVLYRSTPWRFGVELPRQAVAARIFASPLARRLAKEAGLDLAALDRLRPAWPRHRARCEDGACRRRRAEAAPASRLRPAWPTRTRKFFAPGSFEEIPHDYDAQGDRAAPDRSRADHPAFLSQRRLRDRRAAAPARGLQFRRAQGRRRQARRGKSRSMISSSRRWRSRCSAVPDANVTFTPEAMLRHKSSDVGVAVSIPGGLITPIIRNAAGQIVREISDEIKELAGARQRATS